MNGYAAGILLLIAGCFAHIIATEIQGKFDPIPIYIGLVGMALCWIVEAVYRSSERK